MFLKSTLMALALAGTALVTASAANAQDYNRNQTNAQDTNRTRDNVQNDNRNQALAQDANRNRNNSPDTNRNHRSMVVGFGEVHSGYRNGYMGNDRSWHRWEHRNDYISYRRSHRGRYHDWNRR